MKGSRWTVWMESCRTAITNCTSECLYDCSYCRTEARYSCHSPYVKVSELLLLHMSGSLCQGLGTATSCCRHICGTLPVPRLQKKRGSVPLQHDTDTSEASCRHRGPRGRKSHCPKILCRRGFRYRYLLLQARLWHLSGTETPGEKKLCTETPEMEKTIYRKHVKG